MYSYIQTLREKRIYVNSLLSEQATKCLKVTETRVKSKTNKRRVHFVHIFLLCDQRTLLSTRNSLNFPNSPYPPKPDGHFRKIIGSVQIQRFSSYFSNVKNLINTKLSKYLREKTDN